MSKLERGDSSRMSRRDLLAAAASVTAFAVVPRRVLGGPETPPSEKLNVACIGVGGKGFDNVRNVSTENIVALCDVDAQRASDAFGIFPKARRYTDFRRLLDQEEKNIDAVVVSTPDHVHILASVMAMKMGKHVYCEKPLGHNIHEVRLAAAVAQESRVATQMGNAGHSSYNHRTVVALIKAGTIGEVKEVHAWCENEWENPSPEPCAGAGSVTSTRNSGTMAMDMDAIAAPISRLRVAFRKNGTGSGAWMRGAHSYDSISAKPQRPAELRAKSLRLDENRPTAADEKANGATTRSG